MSTKTTFKRVALVAVASLGFGVLSSIPSNAADVNAAAITALTEEATVKITAMKVTNAVVRKGTAVATDVSVALNVLLREAAPVSIDTIWRRHSLTAPHLCIFA